MLGIPWNIEEPPTQVPWDCPKDVPMVVRFRHKDGRGSFYPESVHISGVKFGNYTYPWCMLADAYEHTTDGINWKPCTKEAK
jgi:hypothetical protein